MKKSTKVSLVLTPALSLIIIGALWLTVLKPLILKSIKSQIPKINSTQEYVTVTVEDIEFSLLKLRAYIKDTKINLNGDETNSVTIPSLRIQIDPFNLLVGQLQISYLRIDRADIVLNESILKISAKDKTKNNDLDLKPLFDLLPEIPIDRVVINRSNVIYKQKNPILDIETKLDRVNLRNLKKSLALNVQRSQNSISTVIENKLITVTTNQSLQLQLDENSLELNTLTLNLDKSFVTASGKINDIKKLTTEPNFSIETSGLFVFENLRPLYYFIGDKTKRPPEIGGQLTFDGSVSGKGFQKNTGQIDLKTENVQFNYLKFGDADIKVSLKNNEFSFNDVRIDHPAGKINLAKLEIIQREPYTFNTSIVVQNFNLQKLFNSLDLKNIPADLTAKAKAGCTGQIYPFNMICDSNIDLNNIYVKTDLKNKDTLVEVEQAHIDGNLKLTQNQLTYEAKSNIKDSSFTSTGNVDFEKGFNLKFKSDSFKLENLKNLANLNMKGTLSGELETQGTTDAGTISSRLSAKNFIIDQFKLGNLSSQLSYKSGSLTLKDIKGEVKQSLYEGELNLNFNTSHLNGHVNAHKLYGQSILHILNERFSLPFSFTGLGYATMDFNGPFDFWKLKYTLNAELKQGSIADESFSKLSAQLNATGDKINFNEVILYKPTGRINVGGSILTSHHPTFDLNVKSHHLKLEEIDHALNLFPKSTGNVNLNAKIHEPLEKIEITGQASIKDLVIDSQSLPSSQGDIRINQNYFQFNGQVFGRQMQAYVQVPFKAGYDYVIKSQLHDFNPMTLLPLIKVAPPNNSDTYSSLSADIDLKSSYHSFPKFNGAIKINSFTLQKNLHILKLQKPSEVTFQSGFRSLSPILLKGQDQQIEIKQNQDMLYVNGQLQLKTIQFLVPALDNLTGLLNLNFGLNMNSHKMQFVGNGVVKDGLVQIKGFPYPIREINANLDFSQSKLIINQLQASLNQSPITGQGYLNFLGPNNIDINIQADSSKVDLEFPPQIQTSGLVKLKITGQWMPYTLKLDYIIDHGLVSKEFTEADENKKFTLTPSKYLPEQKLTAQTPSLIFDINAQFNKGIVVKNSLLEGVALGAVQVTGSPEAPIISGRINVQPGSNLIFKDKPFEIQNGYVIFNPDHNNSPEINPEIFINASARVSDYDINLLITGRADNLNINPTSQPPLSRDDIFSLLALGYTTATQDQNLTSTTQQKQTGLEVLSVISNQSRINKQIQEKLGLNVQISPSVDSTKNIAVPKVIVSKKLGKKINASYARPLTGAQQSNEVKLQWLFHPDFSLNLNYQNETDSEDPNVTQKTNDQAHTELI